MSRVVAWMPAKLGACHRCMALTTALLVASLVALGLAAGGPAGALLVAALATGFFSTLGTAHAAAFALRRVYGQRQPCGCR